MLSYLCSWNGHCVSLLEAYQQLSHDYKNLAADKLSWSLGQNNTIISANFGFLSVRLHNDLCVITSLCLTNVRLMGCIGIEVSS